MLVTRNVAGVTTGSPHPAASRSLSEPGQMLLHFSGDSSFDTELPRSTCRPRPVSSCQALRCAVSNLTRLDDFYCEKIGAGFFSEVFRVTHRTTGQVMVLKMNLLASNRPNMLREVQLMNQLSHPNILKFMGVCVHEGQLHALTEYINGGSLEQLIASDEDLPWKLRIKLARDIAKGLDYLHSKGFFHRDLTSKNVLIKRDESTHQLTAVVGDFGFATKIPDPRAPYRLPTVGSPYWMSPECLRGEWYNERSDLFSYGIILCELIGRVEADPDVLPRTENFGLDYLAFTELCPDCPTDFLKLAFSCCHMDPAKRPNLDVLILQLESMLRYMDTPASVPESLVGESGGPTSDESKHQSTHQLDEDVYLVAGKSPSEKARCHYVSWANREECDVAGGDAGQPGNLPLTPKLIGEAMSAGDPYYRPNNTAQNPFATLKRFKMGHKIVDMDRNSLFSSCCELAWPALSASGSEASTSSKHPPLSRHASRSLPSSPLSPRRRKSNLSPVSPPKISIPDSTSDSQSLTTQNSPVPPDEQQKRAAYSPESYKSQDDLALGKLRYSLGPLKRRGSCESGFFSVGDPDFSLSLDDASCLFRSRFDSLEDNGRSLSAWNLFKRSSSIYTDSYEDLCSLSSFPEEALRRKHEFGQRDIRKIVEYFEKRSQKEDGRPENTSDDNGQTCSVRTRLDRGPLPGTKSKPPIPKKTSLQRLRICEGAVRSKLRLFDRKE